MIGGMAVSVYADLIDESLESVDLDICVTPETLFRRVGLAKELASLREQVCKLGDVPFQFRSSRQDLFDPWMIGWQSFGHLRKVVSSPELDIGMCENRSSEFFRRLLNKIG